MREFPCHFLNKETRVLSKMDSFLKIKLSYSVLLLVIILLMHGRDCLCYAPGGCLFNDGGATCDFYWWTPPLLHTDFGPEPLHGLILKNISGYIPAGAFSGRNGSLTSKDTYIHFYCSSGKLRLSRDIYTPNLHWVMNIWILTCTIENGLSSRFLENLINLKSVIISGSTIEGSVANDAFAGLTNLQTLVVNLPFINDKIPHDIFDGLNNLTTVGVSYANLNHIPVTLFSGLGSLETINLNSNNLSTLPRGLFDGLISLTHVTLEDNPWNCSCELMWLLDWLHITDEIVCQNPPVAKNFKLENATELIDCVSPALIFSSLLLSSETANKITEVQRSSFATIAVPSSIHQTRTTVSYTSRTIVSNQPTSSKMVRLISASTLTETRVEPATPKVNPMPSTSVSMSTAVASVLMTPTAMTFPNRSWSASTAFEIGIEPKQLLSLSPIATTRSTFMQAMHSSTPNESVSLNSKNSTIAVENDLRNILLISGGSALAGSVSGGALLYRYVFRHKCAGG